jgi:soluble lytic murein transglycosylase-like protein
MDIPEWSGTEAIRNGDYEKALEDIQSDTIVTDSAFHFFKLGCIQQGLKNWSKTLFYFKLTIQMKSLFSPYAFERIGDIECAQGRFESALISYRVAAQKTPLLPYRYTLYRKMYALAIKHSDTLGTLSWLEEIVGEDTGIPDTSMKELFTRLIESGKSRELDSALLKFIDPDLYSEAQCYICSILSTDTLTDSLFSTKTLYRMSKLAYTCRQYRASSDWLHKALERKDFAKEIPQKGYIYHRAMLNYRMRNYSNVIKWVKKYEKQYGSDPTLVYIIARAYRSLGKRKQAAHWYDKHILLFPYQKKTHDIIWYRAWQKEDANEFENARRFYKILFEKHKNRQWGDDACFRYALSYCKEKKYKSALEAFSSFIDKYPSSSLAMGARYWKVKCYFALQQYEKSQEECITIIERYPANYYAYRAREMLLLINDTLQLYDLKVDTTYSEEELSIWLDSIDGDSLRSFSGKDSIRFSLGTLLAAVGMQDHAELVLEPFEVSYGEDLLLQYEIARLFTICDAPTSSFRIARRLSWRIPQHARTCMPIQIYSLLYPYAFSEYIAKGAADNNIEPELVTAIIRQESVFDPNIVSPVGAIGLMQIMPYTGEEIAKDLHEDYIQESLYKPSVNIRYGSYYIKKVLRQLNDNMVLAIAGYNGGPHNAKKWRAQNSDDGFDMFVEDIGFSETRKYVKKVLGNYWTYKELKKFRERINPKQ